LEPSGDFVLLSADFDLFPSEEFVVNRDLSTAAGEFCRECRGERCGERTGDR